MKATYVFRLGVAAAAVIAVFVFTAGDRQDQSVVDSSDSLQAVETIVERSSERSNASLVNARQESAARSPGAPKSNWRDLLGESADYLTFVNHALSAAQSGDAAAQFAIFEALAFCEDGYRSYFIRSGKQRTLDEALNWASTRSAVNMDHVRAVYSRCDALMNNRSDAIGDAARWLEKSASAGNPIAQARKALADLEAVELKTAGLVERTKKSAAEFEARRGEARSLMMKALSSSSPDATWSAADSIKFISGSEATAAHEQWVWRMAACIQGYDCTSDAAWHITACRFDRYCLPGESGVEYIHRASGQDAATFDARAHELVDRLQSGQFNDADMDRFMGIEGTP